MGAPYLGRLRHPEFRAPLAPQMVLKNVTRSMGIPNMCLVLKSYNGKVVSIANGQNHRQNHANIQYRIII